MLQSAATAEEQQLIRQRAQQQVGAAMGQIDPKTGKPITAPTTPVTYGDLMSVAAAQEPQQRAEALGEQWRALTPAQRDIAASGGTRSVYDTGGRPMAGLPLGDYDQMHMAATNPERYAEIYQKLPEYKRRQQMAQNVAQRTGANKMLDQPIQVKNVEGAPSFSVGNKSIQVPWIDPSFIAAINLRREPEPKYFG
jgi:hypothetical protein